MDEVTFLGQAGLYIEYQDLKILCDPWLSQGGAFLGSWHQFPRNDHLDWKQFQPTHLYISHKHEDHLDRKFLATLDKEIEVLCPKHISLSTYKILKGVGFEDIYLMEDQERVHLSPSVIVEMFLDRVIEDSALLLKLGNFNLFDLNDCALTDETLSEIAKEKIDLCFLQFSGAQYYPIMYEYGLEEKQTKVDLFVAQLKERYKRRTSILGAKVNVPSAGPACFLDEKNFPLNFGSIFPDPWEFFDFKNQNTNVMFPGESLSVPQMREGKSQYQSAFSDGHFSDKQIYLLEYSKQRGYSARTFYDSLPEPREYQNVRLQEYLRSLVRSSSYFASGVGCIVQFHITGNFPFDLYCDFTEESFYLNEDISANYRITLDSKYLELILSGYDWDDFLLSMQYSLWRNPDVYNWPLFALLRFGFSKSLLRYIENISKDNQREFIEVESNGVKYRIPKYCPHAGEDLSKALIQKGTITCSRHNWCFDLETGKCLSGGNMDLKVQKL